MLHAIFLEPGRSHTDLSHPKGDDDHLAKLLWDAEWYIFASNHTEKATWNFILYLDNMPPQQAHICDRYYAGKRLRNNLASPYFTDLVLLTFWLFWKLKYHLCGNHYSSRAWLGSHIFQWFNSTPKKTSCRMLWNVGRVMLIMLRERVIILMSKVSKQDAN